MTTPAHPPVDLPPLDDERVDDMEKTIFARIGADRADRRRRRARVGGWSAAAACVLIVAAVVGPAVMNGANRALTGQYSAGSAGSAGDMAVPLSGDAPVPLSFEGESGETAPATGTSQSSAREIVANGSATVEAADVATAITVISEAATAAGGYVESSQVGGFSGAIPIEGDAAGSASSDPSTAWITVRVPADALTDLMDELSTVGTVSASSVTRSDVTDQAVDLRARVAAAEASVARLTELMAQAASVADLISAESALAERQAQLDADRQQLTLLESQVAMSSLSVQVVPAGSTVAADPAGFTDGLIAGWNGLVAALNGLVIGLGFLLPWLAVAAVVGVVVWGVRRARRRRSARADD